MVCVTLFFLLLAAAPARACTLWAANGSVVKGGGSMIVKNRDWIPNQIETLKLVTPGSGYRYLGLYAAGKYGGIKAGINEKGLVVVSATVASLPAKERRAMPHSRGVLVKLLRECGSVEEALARTDLFLGPEILMLADKNQVATIEIGPAGKFLVTSRANGSIYHTNHYVDNGMQGFNQRIGESSLKRYVRIGHLLASAATPYDFKTFLSFSGDRGAGPNDSIFRTGSTPGRTRTVAVWAVDLPKRGAPQVFVKILNPGEKVETFRLNAADAFSGHWHRRLLSGGSPAPTRP
jgi:hypothetical protein